MSTSKLLRLCGSLCCAALLLGVVSVSAAHSATVTTNKQDYVPGEIVVVTGSGYLAGETVTITLQESPPIDTHGPYALPVEEAIGGVEEAVTDAECGGFRPFLSFLRHPLTIQTDRSIVNA